MATILMPLVVGTLTVLSLSVGGLPAPDPGVIYAAAPEERGAFHVGGKGVYNYGYNTGDGIAKVEVRHPDGSVTGSYRYFDAHGRQIVRSYIADNKGFRVLGNELPVAPDTPALGILDAQTLTGPVEGTQEFLSPNIITNDDSSLLIQNKAGRRYVSTSSRKASGITSANAVYQQKLVQQQKDFAQQQRELIRQQEEKLAQLKLQHQEYLNQQQQQIDQLKALQQKQQQQANYQTPQNFQQSQSGYVSSINQHFDLNSPYFYSDDKIDYDFPAGFAYNVVPTNFANPVGLKGDQASLLVTAGHTNDRGYKNPHHDISWNRSYQRKSYRHPYILGHAR